MNAIHVRRHSILGRVSSIEVLSGPGRFLGYARNDKRRHHENWPHTECRRRPPGCRKSQSCVSCRAKEHFALEFSGETGVHLCTRRPAVWPGEGRAGNVGLYSAPGRAASAKGVGFESVPCKTHRFPGPTFPTQPIGALIPGGEPPNSEPPVGRLPNISWAWSRCQPGQAGCPMHLSFVLIQTTVMPVEDAIGCAPREDGKEPRSTGNLCWQTDGIGRDRM